MSKKCHGMGKRNYKTKAEQANVVPKGKKKETTFTGKVKKSESKNGSLP